MDFPSDDFTVAEFLRHPQRDEWFRDVLRYIHQSKRTEFITPDGDKRYALYSNKSLNRVVDLRKLGTSFSPIAPPDAPILTVTEDPDNLTLKLAWTTAIGNYNQFYIERSAGDSSHFVALATLVGITSFLSDDDGGLLLLDDGGRLIVEQGLNSTLVGAVYGYSYNDVFASNDGIRYYYRVRGLRNGIYSAWSNIASGQLTHGLNLVDMSYGTPGATYYIVGATGSLSVSGGMVTAGNSAIYQWHDPGGADYDNSHVLWPYAGVHVNGTGGTIANFDVAVGIPHAIADGTYSASINLLDAAGSFTNITLNNPTAFTVSGGAII